MIPLTTDQYKWGFVCGRITALESRLLSKDFFLSLAAHPRTEDLLRQLQETPLQEFVVAGAAWQDWTQIIDSYFHNRATSLRDDSPDPGVANLFLLAADFLNLKRALTGQNTFPFPPGTLSSELLQSVSAGDRAALPEPVREALGAFAGGPAEGHEGPPMDLILDSAYLRHFLIVCRELKVPLISACAEDLVLSRALTVLWRAIRAGQSLKPFQQYFLPLDPFTSLLNEAIVLGDPKAWGTIIHGKLAELLTAALEQTEDEQAPWFEQAVANHLTDLSKRGQGQVYGPERVFSYLSALAVEVYNLKLIVCGRLNRIDANVLKGRLRECYG